MSETYFQHEKACPVYGDTPRDDEPCKCIDQRLSLFMREWEKQGHEGSDLCADEVLAVCSTFFKAGQKSERLATLEKSEYCDQHKEDYREGCPHCLIENMDDELEAWKDFVQKSNPSLTFIASRSETTGRHSIVVIQAEIDRIKGE